MAGVEGTPCCCLQNPVGLCQWSWAVSGPLELGHTPTLLLLTAPMATWSVQATGEAKPQLTNWPVQMCP